MKLVIQRVSKGKVSIIHRHPELRAQARGEGSPLKQSQINKGFVVLVGFRVGDTQKNIINMTQKLLNLRIMPDEKDKMNLSIVDIEGELLLVPQFTLYADTSSRRPGFTPAAKPQIASQFFDQFVEQVRKSALKTEIGQFGAYMQVEILNDGPVTIILDN